MPIFKSTNRMTMNSTRTITAGLVLAILEPGFDAKEYLAMPRIDFTAQDSLWRKLHIWRS